MKTLSLLLLLAGCASAPSVDVSLREDALARASLTSCAVSGLPNVTLERAYQATDTLLTRNRNARITWHNKQHTGTWDIDVTAADGSRPIATFVNDGTTFTFSYPASAVRASFHRYSWDVSRNAYVDAKSGFECDCSRQPHCRSTFY